MKGSDISSNLQKKKCFADSMLNNSTLNKIIKRYPVNELFDIKKRKLNCSPCRWDEMFISFASFKPHHIMHFALSASKKKNIFKECWFGTYSIPPTKTELKGPKLKWVPKPN